MKFIKDLLKKEIVRYIIAGGCTTLVNLVTFYILRMFTDMSRSVANVIAITLAIIFAFFANKFFVFTDGERKLITLIREFISFVATRLVAMLVEVIGTNILCDSFRYNELISKIIIQVVVVLLNYVFGKCFVFTKEKKSLKAFIFNNYVILLSFLIPALFMLGVWIASDIGPFGGNSITYVDSLHQYLPFFSDYQDKLQNEGSLFYTWNIGLGSNLLSIIAYYIACPINFLVVLFDRSHLYVAMCLFISIKIAISGMTFAYYMTEKCKDKKKFVIILFATAYALSNYVIAYSWNLMWMDCIMILPLIMAGFERMVEKGDCKLYIISLFYGLMCNYYICFMICLFLILQFFLINHKGIKKFFTDGLKFAGCSILAAAMSSFLLIPAYLGLNTTSSATREFPESSWYGSIWDLIKQLFFLTKPIKNQQFDGGLNAYCGSICFILVFVYLFHRRIKIWDKVRHIFLLVLLMVSFNNQLLNYIWHGLHDQYGIPNRFSFLFVFLLLVMSCEALVMMEKEDIISLVISIILGFGFLILTYRKCELAEETLIGTEICLGIYAVVLIAICMTKGIAKQILSIILVLACLAETVYNGIKGYDSNGFIDMSYYFEQEDQMTAAIDTIDTEGNAYRTELMATTIVDEPTYYNLRSVSLFGSTVSADLVDAMHDLGYYTGANEFLFDGGNQVSNALLGIKYLLQRDGEYNSFDVDYVDTVEGINIYENPYALNLGFEVNEELLNWNDVDGNMFDTLNSFVENATGVSGVYSQIYPEFTTYSDNCSVTHDDDLSEYFSYTRNDGATECNFQISFPVTEESSDIYVMANCSGISKVRVYVDGEEQNYARLQYQSYHVGHLVNGQEVTIEYCFDSSQAYSGSARLIVAELNWDAYLQAYDILSANQMQLADMEDGYVKGCITMENSGLMFTSIPYDAGWTAYVDGEKADIEAVGNAFIALRLTEGEHTIELTYFPPGLKPGIMLTALGWIIFAWLCGRKKKISEIIEENN